MSEVGGSHLGFDERFGEKAFASEDVLIEEFDDDVLDVGDVDFVNDTVDTFSEEFPHHFLVFDAASVFFEDFLLHGSETMGRDVDASSSEGSGGVLGFEFLIVFFGKEVGCLFESLDERGIFVLLLGNVVNRLHMVDRRR